MDVSLHKVGGPPQQCRRARSFSQNVEEWPHAGISADTGNNTRQGECSEEETGNPRQAHAVGSWSLPWSQKGYVLGRCQMGG